MNPLSAIYSAVSGARNGAYDRGILRSRKLSRPVISVGNISVGGSGKTPFVILLGGLFKERGITFDVISRGYGRETRGVLVVEPDGSPRKFGDEPLLIAKRLGCPVIVGESRYQAGTLAERQYSCGFHILDDGFQHRSLTRDFDIVLLAADDLNQQLLPAGRLREPLTSFRRADAIAVAEDMSCSELPAGKPMWRVSRSLETSAILAFERPIVFCGIAKPEKFVQQLRAVGVQPIAEKFYRDHHRYTERDIGELIALRERHHADGFISTEKDAINLGQHSDRLAPIVFPRVKMELLEPADALDTMLRVIGERRAGA